MKIRSIKIVLLFLLGFALSSCAQNTKSNKNTDNIEIDNSEEIIIIISPENLNNIESTIQLIDVRTPEEYTQGYIKDAKNVNFFDSDFLDQMASFNKQTPLYVYCKSGRRSASAAIKLKELGFTKVYDLEGGILNWQKSNLEITKK